MSSIFAEITVQRASSSQAAIAPEHLPRLDQVQAILNSNFTGAWSNVTQYKAGQSTQDGGSFYIANVDNTNLKPSDNTPVTWRLAASKGDSAYVYVAYASDASGTGFTNSFDSSKDYIAIKATTAPIASPAAGDFAGLWKNYKGTPGGQGDPGTPGTPGTNGAAAYVYIAYASDNVGTGFTTTFNAALNFIAIKTTTLPISSPVVTDFTGLWKQYGVPALSTGSPLSYNATTGVLGINASSANTASYLVQRDASGNFAAGKVTLLSTNATDHLTMGGQTIGFNTDAFYFSQPIAVPTKVKLGTSHELRNTSSNVQLYSVSAGSNAWETSGATLIVAALRLTGLSGALKADGSGNVAGSATTDDVTEGSTNLYYTDTRANTAADARIAVQKAAANGLASLDSGGKLSSSQIPASLLGALDYQGTWNANTNSPALSSGSGTKGFFYKVSVAGATNLDGITDWNVGDWAVYNGASWDKIDNTEAIISVNGATGTVVLTTSNIAEGSNLYHTDARVGAAVLTSLSAGTGGTISATDSVLIAFGKTENRLAALEARTTSTISEGSNLYYSDARVKAIASTGLDSVIVAPAASTTGSPSLLTVTGPAHTGLTASTEATDVYLNLARIVQFATGALSTQRAVRVTAPKYAFVATSTLTDASTLSISGAPIAWSNATITNSAALRIYPGAVASSNTNAYGLYVEAPTSGANNFAAVFPTGSVGIGTAMPTVMLDIASNLMRLRTAHTPASSSETGDIGTICWDASYIYVWTAANTVKRAALSTF